VLAHLTGIKVFGTGGLGGVHRGAESSMDISADLTELGRTPVTVISSGCKSFLDIPRTLEYLETQGVGVGTFADGRQDKVDFPAFWSRESGVKSPMVIRNEIEAAAIIRMCRSYFRYTVISCPALFKRLLYIVFISFCLLKFFFRCPNVLAPLLWAIFRKSHSGRGVHPEARNGCDYRRGNKAS